jgi:hypothetical protein
MKDLVSLIFFFHWSIYLIAQSSEITFFDQQEKKTIKSNSYYSRQLKEGTSNFYISKFQNGNVAFEGQIIGVDSADESQNRYFGICNWYYKNGKKRIQRSFDKDGKENGKTSHFFESGKIWKNYFWAHGTLKDRKFLEFDEKGNVKQVFEEIFSDNSNDWDIYSSNKSLSEIIEKNFRLASLTDEGTSRIIRVENNSKQFSVEGTFLVSKKNLPKGKHGLIFGFKDWQNYFYYLIQGERIYIGEVFEGINNVRRDGHFSGALYSNPERVNLKVLNTNEGVNYSINGDVQYTSSAISLSGSGIGFAISGKGELFVSNLIQKEFDILEPTENNTVDTYIGFGSGLILSRDGYLVTNHHVIENGKNFEIVVFENGIPKNFNAKKINQDQDNDLAILKIEDEKFKPFDKIRYNFKMNQAVNVGGSVFSIGFPLQTILGQEPKFVDGKVSSKTGFKNSISTFQTSVPIQPGNSGSPLFNESGELIAIMNSVVSNTENVSYGIKLAFLQNLIDLLPVQLDLPNTNFPPNATIEDMVKVLSNYTVLIKVKL